MVFSPVTSLTTFPSTLPASFTYCRHIDLHSIPREYPREYQTCSSLGPWPLLLLGIWLTRITTGLVPLFISGFWSMSPIRKVHDHFDKNKATLSSWPHNFLSPPSFFLWHFYFSLLYTYKYINTYTYIYTNINMYLYALLIHPPGIA
jgi:hypothetical protein